MSDDGYVSTRGGPSVPLRTALFGGVAPDGGLYVPESLPRLDWPPPASVEAGGTDLRPVARWAAPVLFSRTDPALLTGVVDGALDFPVPMRQVEPDTWVLELFHGPTQAFKDVGARFMAFLVEALEPSPQRGRTVLVATSGDTGGAVASAFHGRRGCAVVALFPRGGVSERQRRQMTTLGGNVHALAVEGTFDDCQRLAKEAFRDPALAERHGLMSANSINVARLLPQAFYYLHAARALGRPWFFVPAGNLGNLCAGLLAARAGMPAAGFMAATNENRVFVDYLRGETFEPRPSVPTSSSAMDVGDPSNLERIRWLFGGDDDTVRRSVGGESVTQDEVLRCIAELHGRTGYVADPHTAVAYVAATRHPREVDTPRVVLATAHPAKFPDTVRAATGVDVDPPPGLLATLGREERMRTIGPHLADLTEMLEELSP